MFYQVSTVTGELRYVDALRLLNTLEDASKRLDTIKYSNNTRLETAQTNRTSTQFTGLSPNR